MNSKDITEEEHLFNLTRQMEDLHQKFEVISDNSYAPESKCAIGRIYEGNFEMTLIGGDIVHPKALQLNDPPYRLGEFGHYFHFRIDKQKEINKLRWGDFEWYTSSPECFTKIANGIMMLTVEIHKNSTEYIISDRMENKKSE
jgi:hypothetical protein